ncbi:MAG: arylamine N-acetyltransferase [Terriglobales bacterium]
MDVSAYLRRINYAGPLEPMAEVLAGLHRAHMMAVPFENLDIALKRPIVLDEERFFDKIVVRRRGGFCYELNGLFAALLLELGFRVTLLSARVADAKGRAHMEFDHMTLRVDLAPRGPDGTPESWLADVGFGDCFLEPLSLVPEMLQPQGGATYRLMQKGERWKLQRRDHTDWNMLYDFTLAPRQLAEFSGMCHYHQTSPDSHFTQRSVCSRVTPTGRVTLADMRLIWTDADGRKERMLASEEERAAVLREQFGVELNL